MVRGLRNPSYSCRISTSVLGMRAVSCSTSGIQSYYIIDAEGEGSKLAWQRGLRLRPSLSPCLPSMAFHALPDLLQGQVFQPGNTPTVIFLTPCLPLSQHLDRIHAASLGRFIPVDINGKSKYASALSAPPSTRYGPFTDRKIRSTMQAATRMR